MWALFLVSALIGAGVAYLIGSPTQLIGVSRIADSGDTGRFYLWNSTLALISDRPLFGYGEGQTSHLLNIPWVSHPHNIVLQVLLAWGVAGLLLAGGLALWAVRNVLERVDDDTLPLVIAAGILAIYSLVDGAIYNVHTAGVFAACLGVALKSGTRSNFGGVHRESKAVLAPFLSRLG